ncbi:hypothetical protein K440DRAFT_248953 [Wilcoxina mikolae CBS 423.85]|nr:hypothetical protein K440DRAFT_248953 [Wilcoxina mikolae CBS 423.85]
MSQLLTICSTFISLATSLFTQHRKISLPHPGQSFPPTSPLRPVSGITIEDFSSKLLRVPTDESRAGRLQVDSQSLWLFTHLENHWYIDLADTGGGVDLGHTNADRNVPIRA